MADSTPVSDVVCVDDMGKARVMEPVLADKVSSLKDQCADFLNGTLLFESLLNLIVHPQQSGFNHYPLFRYRALS